MDKFHVPGQHILLVKPLHVESADPSARKLSSSLRFDASSLWCSTEGTLSSLFVSPAALQLVVSLLCFQKLSF